MIYARARLRGDPRRVLDRPNGKNLKCFTLANRDDADAIILDIPTTDALERIHTPVGKILFLCIENAFILAAPVAWNLTRFFHGCILLILSVSRDPGGFRLVTI